MIKRRLFCSLVLFVSPLARAATVGVAGSFLTISAALNAGESDIELIDSLHFEGNITITGVVTIHSTGTSWENGPGAADLVSIETDASLTVEGVSIQNVGSVVFQTEGDLTLRDVTLTNNSGPLIESDTTSTVSIINTEITENTHSGVLFDFEGPSSITDSIISSNTSLNRSIFSTNALLELTNTDVTANEAHKTIFQLDNGGVLINSSFVSNLGGLGAAVQLNPSGNVSLVENCLFSSNTSTGKGVLSIGEGDVTVSKSTFTENEAEKSAAIYLDRHTTVTIINSTFLNNTATVGDGGAIRDDTTSLTTIHNSLFAGNNSFDQGGALDLAGTTTISQSRFCTNTAFGGGALYLRGDTTITNSLFELNQADQGATIHFNGTSLSLNAIVVRGNGPGDEAITSSSSLGLLQVTNSLFTENEDAFYLDSTSYTFENLLFWDNASNISPVGGGNVGALYSLLNPYYEPPLESCSWSNALLVPTEETWHVDGTQQNPNNTPSHLGVFGGPNAVYYDHDSDGLWAYEDCDPYSSDVDSSTPTSWVKPIDWDGDGYFSWEEPSVVQCFAPVDYIDEALVSWDCDDSNQAVHTSAPEVCDGVDNDCDDYIDEGHQDNDLDGIADCVDIEECDGIDNDGDGAVDEGFPDSDGDGEADCVEPELCDGLDNNGDGLVDEGFPDTDLDGTADCVDIEECDGVDNNGDGQVDEGFPDTDADGAADCVDVEECDGLDNDGDDEVDEGFPDTDLDGIADCVDVEECDGLDNDGDGEVDEGFPVVDGDGTPDCAVEEVCDGLDNNGDGFVDEGFSDTDQDGTADCVDVEECDGLDNNGDGFVDEGFSDTDQDGTADCVDVEECDGLDNNGDGFVDEGFSDTDSDGTADCVDVEECDGLDNNGDGQIDEGFFDTDRDGTADCVDVEECDGTDNNGDGEVDEGFPDTDNDGNADCVDVEECDGVDNDGDGEVDEGCPTTSTTTTTNPQPTRPTVTTPPTEDPMSTQNPPSPPDLSGCSTANSTPTSLLFLATGLLCIRRKQR